MEKFEFKKLGKYRAWYIIGSPIIIVFFTLMFTNVGNGATAASIVIIAFCIKTLMQDIQSAAVTAQLSQLSDDQKERNTLSVTRNKMCIRDSYNNGDFSEVSHRDCDGDTQILEIMRAYHDCGYKGYIRPDHGRHLWGEEKQCRPGYGLYDRALGIMYLLGCWDMLDRIDGK